MHSVAEVEIHRNVVVSGSKGMQQTLDQIKDSFHNSELLPSKKSDLKNK